MLFRLATTLEGVDPIGELASWGGIYYPLGYIDTADPALEGTVPGRAHEAYWVVREDASGMVTVYEHADPTTYLAAVERIAADFSTFREQAS
ncbi:hypothetical protein AXK58_14175 [Tsukamurella tyrosinosolvens]|nr:hypothetical protein AXK58_14175 [Tsukamurella tyrosinosolvens]